MDKNTTNDNDSQWTAVLEALSGSLTKGQYATHFLGSTGRFDGSTVTVSLPPSANLPMVENQLQVKVFDAVKRATGGAYAVRFEQGKAEPVTVDELEAEPPKQTPITTKGFTPVVDSLVSEMGLVSAAVYGVVWRYCQMNSRTCYASQQTIGDKLEMTRVTVYKHLKKLEANGYIRCLNPDAATNGETKIYIVTNKVNVMASFALEATVSEGVN